MLGRRIWRFLGHILRQQPENHHITALPWDPRGKEKERLAKNNVTYSVKGEDAQDKSGWGENVEALCANLVQGIR